MKILLDTNIIIDRESHNTKNYSIATLYKWIDKLHFIKTIHPLTKAELMKYHDNDIKESLIIKLGSYNVLNINNDYTPEFNSIVSKYSLDKNSRIDNSLLFQVVNGRVDLLITEDRKIHRKANELNIANKVYTINRFITKCSDEYPDLIDYKVLSVKKMKFGSLDINNHFFDSFKKTYSEFTQWFNRKCDEDAYVCIINDEIVGFLYLKLENENSNYSDIEPQFSRKRRLKVGTFKVESTGFRLGERFLKIIFDNAKENRVDEVYITLFNANLDVARLEGLLERWGFKYFGIKKSINGEEKVLIKEMKGYDKTLSPKNNFPNIKANSNKYILPIYPKYHTSLFPDSILNNEDMKLYMDFDAHKYSLQKVYVFSASYEGVVPGDIVIIYRTGDKTPKKYSSVVTTIAIVDEVLTASSIDEYLKECQNRSVFRKDELIKLFIKYRNIIKLLFYKSLTKRLTLDKLYDLKIVEYSNGPRPFHKLTEQQFTQILNESNTNL